MIYNRILLKLSGEALLGGRSHGIDPKTINKYSKYGHLRSKKHIKLCNNN